MDLFGCIGDLPRITGKVLFLAEVYRMPWSQAVVVLSRGTVSFGPNPDHWTHFK